MKNGRKVGPEGPLLMTQVRMSAALKKRIEARQAKEAKKMGIKVGFSMMARMLLERGLDAS